MRYLLLVMALALVPAWPATAPAASPAALNLMLDWYPNVDHVPIYVAREKGYFEKEGIRVDIKIPSETADALKLTASGHADLAVSYEPQTMIAASRGLKIQVVSRLVAHPLTCLMFLKNSGITSPGDLNGKTIGYTVPGLMDLLLGAFADINGIRDYKAVNVGFSIVPSLVSKSVDAVMGPFKTYETVTMSQKGYETGFFALESWGIPDYEELIFVCGEKVLKEKNREIRAFVRAMDQAREFVKLHPQEALALYLKAVPEADQEVETRAFELTLPHFAGKEKPSVQAWQKFADFALERGLIDHPVAASSLIHNWEK